MNKAPTPCFSGTISEYCSSPFRAEEVVALFDLNRYVESKKNKLALLFSVITTPAIVIFIVSMIGLERLKADNPFLAFIYVYLTIMTLILLWGGSRYFFSTYLNKQYPFSLSFGTIRLDGRDQRCSSDFREYPIDRELFENNKYSKLLIDNIALKGRKPVYFEYVLLKKLKGCEC
jgi:hypothetical protein